MKKESSNVIDITKLSDVKLSKMLFQWLDQLSIANNNVSVLKSELAKRELVEDKKTIEEGKKKNDKRSK